MNPSVTFRVTITGKKCGVQALSQKLISGVGGRRSEIVVLWELATPATRCDFALIRIGCSVRQGLWHPSLSHRYPPHRFRPRQGTNLAFLDLDWLLTS